MINVRKANFDDTKFVAKIYESIIEKEECGEVSIGWKRGVYPTEDTALNAFYKNELFVMEDCGKIVASAKINKQQVEEYKNASWKYAAENEEIMVLHTLVVDPNLPKKGYGTQFVAFYEKYAADMGCKYLRMDTNEKNLNARALYKKLGYTEVGIVQCNFNGINGIGLVCLEKKL